MIEMPASTRLIEEPGSAGLFTSQINRWWIVVGCFLVNIFSAGIFALYAVNIFFVGTAEEYNWPKSNVGMFLSIFFFSSGLGLLGLGWAISRFGTRLPSISLAVGYTITVLALAFLPPSEIWFMTNFFLMGIFGAAATALPFSIAISGYFDKHRGLAFGIGAAGSGLGSAATATIANVLLESWGWRSGLIVFSSISCAVILFSLTFLLRTPPGAIANRRPAGSSETEGTYRSLIGGPLVIIVSILAMNAICAIGILASLVPLLGERGISTSVAAGMISAAGLSSWGARVLIGWLLDRFFAPYVACGTFLLGALGAVLLVYSGAGPLGFVGAFLIGACMGAEQDLAMYLSSRYFPLSAYSKAGSISWLAWAWGGGIGTYIAALSYNLTQDYEVALWIFIMMFVGAGLLVLKLPAYRDDTGKTA